MSPDGPERSGSKETDGFRAVYLAHFDSVFRLLFRITGTRAEAEDLAQEVFLRCHLRFFSGHPPGPRTGASGDDLARPWLYRVAMNLAYNLTRDRARRTRRHRLAGATGETLGTPPGNPADYVERAEERERVRRTLETMPARQQSILLLRYGGLSYREIAETLEIPATSIGTLLARAEDAFREAHREQRRRADHDA